MARDPFDLSQYVTSFSKLEEFNPNPFGFANLDEAIVTIAEAIVLRQIAISVAFGFSRTNFTNVENYNTTSPAGLINTVENFQTAITEFVEGTVIEAFGVLEECSGSPYVGFFHYDNGLPILGLSNIIPIGDEFTEIPQESDFTTPVEFAVSIADNLNEIIVVLNQLRKTHSPMFVDYPFMDDCKTAPPASPPGGGTDPEPPSPPVTSSTSSTSPPPLPPIPSSSTFSSSSGNSSSSAGSSSTTPSPSPSPSPSPLPRPSLPGDGPIQIPSSSTRLPPLVGPGILELLSKYVDAYDGKNSQKIIKNISKDRTKIDRKGSNTDEI